MNILKTNENCHLKRQCGGLCPDTWQLQWITINPHSLFKTICNAQTGVYGNFILTHRDSQLNDSVSTINALCQRQRLKTRNIFKVTESNIRTSCFNQCKTSQNKTSQKRPTGASSHSGYRHRSFYLLTYSYKANMTWQRPPTWYAARLVNKARLLTKFHGLYMDLKSHP